MIDYKTFIDDLWFERRDIISDGYDRAMEYIHRIIPFMQVHCYKSGTEAWTWIIPRKWSVVNAYIKDGGKTLLDLKDHPLHVMSYSAPISGKVTKQELMKHLYSRPENPSVIPYEYSFYEEKWGFCIQNERIKDFTAEEYEVLIDSKYEPGELKVGDIYIPGVTNKEILILAHLDHPCMANDDLSGVAVLVKIAQHLMSRENKFSYRLLIVPETIGSIAYLSHNERIISKLECGIFLEMLGHDDLFSLQKSKQGDQLIDKAAELCLRRVTDGYRVGGFHEVVGNDERVINGPGVNVPTISISRSKFFGHGEWSYPQYHSDADTPEIISIERLLEAEKLVLDILQMYERNFRPKARVKGPICLSRYNLWIDWRVDRQLNKKQEAVFDYMNDDPKSVIEIAYELDVPFDILNEWLISFYDYNLIEKIEIN